ncbi:MAG: hypothetical protein LBI66_04745 [Burkholderiaceae bacterium]|jgi:hypothetical protein|nr:hypothetical protein [Burkholderiaceae bacterium]
MAQARTPCPPLALAVLPLFLAAGAQAAPVGTQLTCHAAADGDAAASGLDWNHATTLQAALGSAACSTIRLKKGVYKPTAGADRSAHFAIDAPVQLLGGYDGSAAAPEARSTDPRLTVLSGDIDDNDSRRTGGITPDAADIQGGNSFNVVVIGGLDTHASSGRPYTRDNTRLDTLTITAGNASGNGNYHGAGLFCNGAGTGKACSPTLFNVVFSGNQAERNQGQGGALYNLSDNAGTASPLIRKTLFNGNSAAKGGGIYSEGWGAGANAMEVRQSSFVGNSASVDGGALYHLVDNAANALRIEDVSFADNRAASHGGAIYYRAIGSGFTGSSLIRFATFSGNRAGVQGHSLYNNAAWPARYANTVRLVASILWNDPGTAGAEIYNEDGNNPLAGLEYSLLRTASRSGLPIGALDFEDRGGNILDQDPQLGTLDLNGGATPSLLPAAGSPVVDAVPSSYCNGQTDQRDQIRPQAGGCDMGAVERPGPVFLLVQVSTAGGTVTAGALPAPLAGGIQQCAQAPGGGPSAQCSASYQPDAQAQVTLTAQAAPAYRFAGWGNDCSGNATTCVLTMDRAHNVLAMFVPDTTYTGPDDQGRPTTLALESPTGTCVLDGAPAFAPASGDLPAGHSFPWGQASFKAMYCAAGERLGISLTLPEDIPANARLFKYLDQQWVPWPLDSVQGRNLRFSITDNTGLSTATATGDSNPAPGAISDPVMLAIPLAGPAAPTPVPGLGTPAVALLGLLTAVGAALSRRTKSSRRIGAGMSPPSSRSSP